ncbi:MAG: aminotransferase class I/II-fold pyridoxal phosphate-dependent enzyme [Vicinamibacterales bacterium]
MDILGPCYEYHEPEAVKAAGIYPYFHALSGSEGPIVTIDGRRVVMLGSNNYLSLTHHPEVLAAAHDAIDRYGTSCTGSRFLNGNLDLHESLEAELAEFTGKEAALVFPSGFLANLGAVSLLGSGPDATLFSAVENHASLIDGTRMSRCGRTRVYHDVAHLASQLSAQPSWPNALVVTDGVFSMTGRVADLKSLVELKKQYGFRIYLDDAHGFGVLGPNGRGLAASLGVEGDVDVEFGTFSKAFASVGGFVAADRAVIEYMRHKVRTLIFSAALPPASAAAALAALRVMKRDASIFDDLWEKVDFFRSGISALGYHTLGSTTPIIPLFVGSETRAFIMCREALEMGVFATPAIYPAVPMGHALIRTSVMRGHTREHLQAALDVLAALKARHEIPDVDPDSLPPASEMDFAAFLGR